MASQKLARDLVLGGVAFVVVFAVPFFPIVLTTLAWELSSMNRHWLATLARLTYAGVVLLTAIAAWKKSDVRLAILFLALLTVAAAFVVLSNWMLVRKFVAVW